MINATSILGRPAACHEALAEPDLHAALQPALRHQHLAIMYVRMCAYIYREREIERERVVLCLYTYIYIYIYTYIHTYTHTYSVAYYAIL